MAIRDDKIENMEIIFDIASTDQHFEQILQLQRENLFSAISAERQPQQGFVFAEHNLPLLKRFAEELPQVIALSNDQVVGYNLGMPVSMRNEIASLVPMFDEFDRCEYKGKPLASYRYMVGGQVCVHKDFRGHGLLSKLYQETKNRLPSGYQLCVTEVAARNAAGINAHQKMGFEVVSAYHDGKELWKIVIWDLRKT
jgi:ribosomal protein S18 acetylase RimI-like enzyme